MLVFVAINDLSIFIIQGLAGLVLSAYKVAKSLNQVRSQNAIHAKQAAVLCASATVIEK